MSDSAWNSLKERLDDQFSRRVDSNLALASSYALFDSRGVLFANGFGEAVPGSTTSVDTRFRVASCTKSVTAVAILRLRDTGELVLDQPITDFFPEFSAHTGDGHRYVPTVRMLMTMSGGLPTDDPWADRQEPRTHAELKQMFEDPVRLISIPGTAFEYSNLGYALLGQVIEGVTRRSYIDYVEEQIFAPLTLSLGFSTGGPETESAPDAIGYRLAPSGWEPQPFTDAGVFSPIGGLFASPTELARWCSWLSGAFSPWDNTDELTSPLSLESRREMQQISRIIQPLHAIRGGVQHSVGYGFGVLVEHDPVWGTQVSHSGGYPGYNAHMRWVPSLGLGITAAENAKRSGVPSAAITALRHAIEFVAEHPTLVGYSLSDVPSDHGDKRDPVAGEKKVRAPRRVYDIARSQPVDETLQRTLAASPELAAPRNPLPFLAVNGVFDVWPDTVRAARALAKLIQSWDDAVAAQWFAMNVLDDIPAAERRELHETAIHKIGGLTQDPGELSRAESSSADHLVWYVRGERGQLRCEIRLTPLSRPLVQTFAVVPITAE
ncbi:serine hydrolase domain-containing protein [Lysinibacter sp. HNR]|uniref:serine hydrolase domain-containing protein n=1 Tax=Lysinibacter sp. HNR TaxID=3031408 RepID=UPI0024351312|nr:serine hydrolase domain-containing protein [Lysinibacter sp. HNR]WGD36887.1 serine hydrolase [Lysinibacter sp. HNR]